jgi:hypothetical protein
MSAWFVPPIVVPIGLIALVIGVWLYRVFS